MREIACLKFTTTGRAAKPEKRPPQPCKCTDDHTQVTTLELRLSRSPEYILLGAENLQRRQS